MTVDIEILVTAYEDLIKKERDRAEAAESEAKRLRIALAKNFTGSKNPRSKLTENEVCAIRASDEPLKVLAGRYGVSLMTISKVRSLQSWRHV